ncbi:DUF4350 domain-containing protein [Desulfonema magnum]|nr:DUF4350 domain-containing protein [Desulfonema magnum]
MKKMFFRISLLFLALCFLTESLGYLTHQLYQFLGVFFLTLYGLIRYPLGSKIENREMFFTGSVLLIISVFFFQGEIIYRVGGTVFFLCSLWLLLRSKNAEQGGLFPLILTTVFYFYFLLFYLYSPPFWYAVKQFSLSFSTLISRFSGDPVIFSSTYLGIPIIILFLIFIMVSFFCSVKKEWKLFLLSSFLLILMNGLYLILAGKMPALSAPVLKFLETENHFLKVFLTFLFEENYPLPRYNYLMNSPILLFVLCLIPLYLILLKRDFKDFSFEFIQIKKLFPFRSARKSESEQSLPDLEISQEQPSGNFISYVIKKKYVLMFLFLIAAATSMLVTDMPGKTSPKKEVILYKEGFLNWSVPDFKNFGSRSAGMFGNLPGFLRAMDFSPRMAGTLSTEVLKHAQILVMINVDNQLPRNETEAIWDFVEKGGSLLILGEHTFYKHGTKRVIFNDILEPFHISVNFDSADWFVGGWLHSYQYASHPITSGMRDDMNDTGIVIGASLRIEPPAFPIVIGKYGYSDPGDTSAEGSRGYLGSLNYEPGEPLGDVVLCAAQHYGKGKLLVFGDTSGFVNAIMVKNPDFINRVFTWLAKEDSPKSHWLRLILAFIFFAFALSVCIAERPSPFTLILSTALSLAIIAAANTWKQHDAQTDIYGKIAYIDVSHGERFSPESWNENAAMGLYLNFMRNGYLTFSLETFEDRKLNTADFLVLIAPSQPFTPKELGRIREFVFSGGNLILTVGWEEKHASEALMKQFGLSLDYVPLGRFFSVIPHFKQKVRFSEAWPVISSDGKAEIIASYEKLPVIMKKRYGEGHIVLIGDSSFFWNNNLEMEKSHVRENIEFLKWLVGNLKLET